MYKMFFLPLILIYIIFSLYHNYIILLLYYNAYNKNSGLMKIKKSHITNHLKVILGTLCYKILPYVSENLRKDV